MFIPSIGLAEFLVLGGIVVLAGHMVLTGAAVVAALVIWRKEAK